HLGRDAFRWLVNDRRFSRVPMALETPKQPEPRADREALALLRRLKGERVAAPAARRLSASARVSLGLRERVEQVARLAGVLQRPVGEAPRRLLVEDGVELAARLRDAALLDESPGEPHSQAGEVRLEGEAFAEHLLGPVEISAEDRRHLVVDVAGQGVDG